MRSLIDSSPFAGLGPIEITRTLGVDKTFTSRLMSALRAEDPVGILRLRPTARFRVGANHARMRSSENAKLLRQFCRPPISRFPSRRRRITRSTKSRPARCDAAGADVFLSELLTDAPRKDPRAANSIWHVGEVCLYPTRRLALVLLIHKNVWPGNDFSLRAYDTAGRDVVVLPDPDREFDRSSVEDTIVRSPANTEALRASPVPRYSDLLRHLTTQLGWKLEEPLGSAAFNKISCEIAYPLYGSQIMLVWE